MKKLIALVLTLVSTLSLAGCNNTKEKQTSTYFFCGESECFAISNGSIILTDTEEVFDGGDLELTQSDLFEEVISYSTTFYTLTNGNRRPILSNSVIDQAGSSVNLKSDLGSISGEDIIDITNISELKENLWFELKTTDLNGEETVYQIHLIFTE